MQIYGINFCMVSIPFESLQNQQYIDFFLSNILRLDIWRIELVHMYILKCTTIDSKMLF